MNYVNKASRIKAHKTQYAGSNSIYPSGPVSSSSISRRQRDPFGAQMAQEIFDFHEQDYDEIADSYFSGSDVECDDEYSQGELSLFSVGELEDMLVERISKFDQAYRRMMIYALKWHYLIEDCESNAQFKKMFGDLQMMRKLAGSDRV